MVNRPENPREIDFSELESMVHQLTSGDRSWVVIHPDGKISSEATSPICVLPGYFDPLHLGHWNILDIARQKSGFSPYFELAINNVDKQAVTTDQLLKRLQQPFGHYPVLITTSPTCVEKARLFPGSVFAIGVDTLLIIGDT